MTIDRVAWDLPLKIDLSMGFGDTNHKTHSLNIRDGPRGTRTLDQLLRRQPFYPS
jgi:hypothetical protein